MRRRISVPRPHRRRINHVADAVATATAVADAVLFALTREAAVNIDELRLSRS